MKIGNYEIDDIVNLIEENIWYIIAGLFVVLFLIIRSVVMRT